jgi:LemA protein
VPDLDRVGAWELRKYVAAKTRRLRVIYRSVVVLVIAIFIGLCGHIIFYYNYLTALESDVRASASKISAALQYRKNLLPVLSESVRSFVQHEGTVFRRTVEARERELTASQRISDELRRAAGAGKGKAGEGPVRDLVQRIMAIAEQYPLLKTSEAFQLLMKQISEAENKIMLERTRYNDSVNAYNTALTMFPGNVYGCVFGFHSYQFFKDQAGPEWEPLKLVGGSSDAARGGG